MSTDKIFRTPEEVAPELGLTKTELRRYCIESGYHTRGSRNRILLHPEDVESIIAWLRGRKAKKAEWWTVEDEKDPFV